MVASSPSLVKRMHRNRRPRTDGGENASSSDSGGINIPRVPVASAEEAFDKLANLPEGVAKLYYSILNDYNAQPFNERIKYYETTRFMSDTHGIVCYQTRAPLLPDSFYAIAFAYPRTFPSLHRRVATPSVEEWEQIGEQAVKNAFPDLQHEELVRHTNSAGRRTS